MMIFSLSFHFTTWVVSASLTLVVHDSAASAELKMPGKTDQISPLIFLKRKRAMSLGGEMRIAHFPSAAFFSVVFSSATLLPPWLSFPPDERELRECYV